ncbi:uncharacterized protein LOC109838398 [Asparagus officinalis]|uniref:uncharacterized protein LOC109838398 n=1 Tax=Asparagus officinalis TaxID=4686 RepID=UPI00098E3713|nr:uncharacterized protein LOC109838398 [Asparagus officinalis]
MQPPSFSGAEGPLVAEEFLKVTETILTVTRIALIEWVDLMDIQLTDTARIWWAAEKTHLERPILWEMFTYRFNRKYFPQSARDELLHPTIRRHQFQKGLDKYIRLALAGRALATHDAVLDAAREIESVQKETEDQYMIQSRVPASPTWNIERPPPRKYQAPQKRQFSQRQSLPQGHPYQHHLCFTCGSPDHISQDWSLPSQKQVYQQAQRQQPPRQIFMMSAVEAEMNDQVITGKVLVSSVSALSLFDSGASHCFLSHRFVSTHSLHITPLTTGWNINTGSGVLVASSSYEACPVVICGKELFVDFLVIDLLSFDAVFGMEWLGSFFSTIDCHRRSVVFEIPDHPRFEFPSGSTSVGPVEYKARPKKAILTAMQVEPEKAIVVQEFEDVFPDDIYGLPPDRAIEFSIELKPRTASISKTPYRMPPAELTELQTQLDDLMQRGLI